MNVLVVDDEPMFHRAMQRSIGRMWADAKVATATSVPEAERALEAQPDVVTLDLGLAPDPPKLLGLGLLKRLVKAGRGDRVM
ncbi:MAG TPA: response regulator [Polyangiaceae bacterium]|jgi:CheY-like chemotaxis protein